MDARRLDQNLAGVTAAHVGLHAMLDDALAAGRLDPAAPSRLPDWTVGHVLTHIARNADSITRVTEASERGELVARYEAGRPGRAVDIEAGCRRPADEQVADVRRSDERLERAWAEHTRWDGRSLETDGHDIPVSDLVFNRWREVEVHRADLGLGYDPTDWPDEYVRLDLRTMEMRWNARRPMGLTGLPPLALQLPPARRLAWLLGREQIEGLDPAGVY